SQVVVAHGRTRGKKRRCRRAGACRLQQQDRSVGDQQRARDELHHVAPDHEVDAGAEQHAHREAGQEIHGRSSSRGGKTRSKAATSAPYTSSAMPRSKSAALCSSSTPSLVTSTPGGGQWLIGGIPTSSGAQAVASTSRSPSATKVRAWRAPTRRRLSRRPRQT